MAAACRLATSRRRATISRAAHKSSNDARGRCSFAGHCSARARCETARRGRRATSVVARRGWWSRSESSRPPSHAQRSAPRVRLVGSIASYLGRPWIRCCFENGTADARRGLLLLLVTRTMPLFSALELNINSTSSPRSHRGNDVSITASPRSRGVFNAPVHHRPSPLPIRRRYGVASETAAARWRLHELRSDLAPAGASDGFPVSKN